MLDSSRAAAGKADTASNEASASSASIATSTRSSDPAACACTETARTPTTVSPATSIERPSPEAAGQRVAPRETVELAVGRPDPLEHALLGAVDDELGRRAQKLDDLGRQLASRRRLTPAGRRAEPAGDDGTPQLRRATSPAASTAPAAGRNAAAVPTQTAPAASATSGGPSPRR